MRPPNRADFKNFMSERGISPKCPCCGTSGFFTGGLAEGEAIAGLAYGVRPPEGGMPAEASQYMRPQISMICSNCGFVRLFDFLLISEWMRQKDSGVEDSERTEDRDRTHE